MNAHFPITWVAPPARHGPRRTSFARIVHANSSTTPTSKPRNPAMNRIPILPLHRLSALLLALSLGGTAAAVDNVQVNCTLTIAGSISLTFCDNAGANASTTAVAWALGAATTSATYVAGTNGSLTPATSTHLRNLSNTTVDIDGTVSDSASWTAENAASANQFRMRGQINGLGYITLVEGAQTEVINGLTVAANQVPWLLELATPTSITVGGGIQQTITVTFTASVVD